MKEFSKSEMQKMDEEPLNQEREFNPFDLPQTVVFNLQMIALADDEMVKLPGAAEKYRFIARHILELFLRKSKVVDTEPRQEPKKFIDPMSQDVATTRQVAAVLLKKAAQEIESLRDQLKQGENEIKEKETIITDYSKWHSYNMNEVKQLKEAIRKYVFGWDKFFGSPRVGQPPSIDPLRKLLEQ